MLCSHVIVEATMRTLGAVILFVLAACGGDDADTTAATTATSAGPGGGGTGGAGGATGGGAAGGGGSDVPLVDQIDCAGGQAPPGTGVTPGDDLHKVTLAGFPQ